MNTNWSNASIVTAANLVTTGNEFELVPDGMTGTVTASDFQLLRIVGKMTFTPQAASTASAVIGYAFARTLADETGVVTTILAPLSTDVDAGAQDILLQDQFTPDFGAKLDATALDLAFNVDVDIRVGRKLDKRNGILLFMAASVNSRISVTFRLRILTGVSGT